MKYLLAIFVIAKVYEVATLPSHYQKPKDITPVVIHHAITLPHHPITLPHHPITLPHHAITPPHNAIQVTRKKKAPNLPYQTYLVQNLHVIPISQHQVHNDNLNNMHGQHNVTQHQQLIPVLIPFHNYVPIQDLTVIPLHRVRETKSGYGVNEDVDRYRNPLGGYGVGWPFGGHGAGHGFHYTYYI